MILDKEALFSDAQAITTTADSENVVYVGGNIAKGTPVEVLIQVVEDFTSLTNMVVSIQTCDTENGLFEDLVVSSAIPALKLKAGYRFPIKFLPNGVKKYLKLKYTVSGSAGAGKITAGIVDGVPESFND